MLLTDARRLAADREGWRADSARSAGSKPVGSGQRSRRARRSLSSTLSQGSVGAYQLQAAIAAAARRSHARPEDTDWPQILALYGLLKRMSANPMVALNHAVPVRHGSRARKGADASEGTGMPTSASPVTIESRRGSRPSVERAGNREKASSSIVPCSGSRNDEPPGTRLPADKGGRASFHFTGAALLETQPGPDLTIGEGIEEARRHHRHRCSFARLDV